MAAPAFVWLLVFLYVPLIFIIGLSFIKKWGTSLIPELGLDNYLGFFDKPYFTILFRSLSLATVTTIITLLCAYPIAYY